jgi:ribosome-binding ATPase YchF (GTP1/OBG family)
LERTSLVVKRLSQPPHQGAKEKGVLGLEGRDYIVQDGDVLVIRHG